MTRSVTTGNTQSFAAWQQNYDFAILFNHQSTSLLSHTITLDNDFIRVMAFNLTGEETITIEQVLGTNAGDAISDYCPVDGPIQLSVTRTSYVLERPGRYRFRLSAGLGSVEAVAFRFATENEATQDIADAILALVSASLKNIAAGPGISVTVTGNTYTINNTGLITASATPSITPTVIANNLQENLNVSSNAGNILTVLPNGAYVPAPNACSIGADVPSGLPQNNVLGKDPLGCLVSMPLAATNNPSYTLNFVQTVTTTPIVSGNQIRENVNVSAAAGNTITIFPDGLYSAGGGGGTPVTPCSFGALVPSGTPLYFLGLDASGCVVKFTFAPGDGIVVTTTGSTVTVTNQCFPCGSPMGDFAGNLCVTQMPQQLSAPCASPPGSVNYQEISSFQVTSVSGGTAPYTYDWSHVTGTATWGASLGGTPTLTFTPSGNSLTIDAQLAGANAGTDTFNLTINSGSYVLVTDSLAATTKWYFSGILNTGSCSAVHTDPMTPLAYNDNIICTTACTPISPSVTFSSSGTSSNDGMPGSNAFFMGNLQVTFNADFNDACSGSINIFTRGSITATITDPLNIMGEGPIYTVPSADISQDAILSGFPNATSDWYSAVTTSFYSATGTLFSYPFKSVTDTKEHSPTNGGFVLAGWSINVPTPIRHDGQMHTVTITLPNPEADISTGQSSTNPATTCCPGVESSMLPTQVIIQNYQG